MNKILLILLLVASVSWGARITLRTDLGAGKYNASTASIWVDGVAPVDGDSVTINQQASGVDTVVFDYSVSLGNNTGNYGHALVINATSETRFAVVQVADGVKLTLKGYATSGACAAYINRYAIFKPMPGCSVYVDAASNYQTIIDNRGIIEATGTAEKPVTFTGQCNWNNNSSAESKSGSGYNYNFSSGICVRNTTNPWISNTAGTGLGSYGNSSISFSSQNPATICQTEVATLSDVNAAGEYYVNYHTGVIYYYNTQQTNSFTVNYKYLTFNGWGISNVQNTTHNEGKNQYCIFEYMGGTGARQYGYANKYKYSPTSTANRQAFLRNCTVSFCNQFYTLNTCSGTAGDPIVVSGNVINHCKEYSTANVITIDETGDCAYLSFTNNVLNTKTCFMVGNAYNTNATVAGLVIRKNTGFCPNMFSTTVWAKTYDSYIDSNTITGFGGLFDARLFSDLHGSVDHPLIIRDNIFSFGNRFTNVISNVTMERNIVNTFLHHGIIAPTQEDVLSKDIYIKNNLFFNSTTGVNSSGIIETGYNHRVHLHNWVFTGNTIGRGCYAILSLGDTQDEGTYSLVTGLTVENNICYQPAYAIARNVNDANELNLFQIKSLDHNLVYNPSTAQTLNYNQQATFVKTSTRYNFDSTRNVAGVCLFDPNYTLPDATNRSLVFTYTSATDQTLQWGGGTAVQLVLDNGTCSAAGTHVGGTATNAYAGQMTDASKTWSTTMNSGTVVRCKWVKITGGTGAGQIRAITNNTATVLTVTPAWTTLPDNTSQYVIIEPELQLFDDGGTEYVRAGIYLPELPVESATDENITITKYNLTSDPLLSDATGSTANDHKVTTSSPALSAGIANTALTIDYFNTTRNDPPAMGFFDHNAATVPVITVEPTSQTVDENHTATFSLTATGVDTYQWRSKANGNVGTSSNTYAFTATLADDGDSIDCVVTNTYGSVTSAKVKLNVNDTTIDPILITVQPQNMIFPYGAYTDTFLYVTSNATHYKWSINGSYYETDNDTLTFEVNPGWDGWNAFVKVWSLGNDTVTSNTITFTEADAPPVVTTDPVSDTTTGSIRMFAEWTGDNVNVAWYRFHGTDTVLLSQDSVLQFTATTAIHGDSVAAVLWNTSDTVMSKKAGIYVVYTVFDSVNTSDSNTIYVHGNFLTGSGWTATLSDSTLTTESGSATDQVFSYAHKITLSIVKYQLVITDGTYTVTLYIGRRKSTGNNKTSVGVSLGL